jgi:hypothetical protein
MCNMFEPSIDRRVLADLSWWHWVLTVPLLAAHLAGVAGALEVAIVLCLLAGGYFFARIGRLQPYPVQIRVAYLGLLLVGSLPWMQWLHWVQVIGTTAMITVGYCALARGLNLLPLNRDEPFTVSFVWSTFFRDPCAGGLVKWSTESDEAPAACCALPPKSTGVACSLQKFQSTGPRKRTHATSH